MLISPKNSLDSIPESLAPVEFLSLGFLCAPTVNSSKGTRTRIAGFNPQTNIEDYIKQIYDRIQSLDYGVDVDETIASVICEGIIGFDIDVKNDKKGMESFQRFVEKYQLPESNLIVKTKSGGEHHYYKIKDNWPNVVASAPFTDVDGEKYDGLDIRSGNSVLFCPVNEDSPYKVIKRELNSIEELTVINDAAYKAFRTLRAVTSPKPSNTFESNYELPDGIEEGSRNCTLYRIMCRYLGLGYAYDELEEMAYRFGDSHCDDPMNPNEVFATFQSAWLRYNELPRESTMRACRERFLLFVKGKNTILIDLKNGTTDKDYNTAMLVESSKYYISYYDFYGVQPETVAKDKPVNVLQYMVKNGLLKRVEAKGYRPGANVYIPIDPMTDKALGRDIRFMYNSYRPPVMSKVNCTAEESEAYVKDLLDLIKHLCANNDGDTKLFLDWLAFVIQNPTKRVSFAPYFVSYQGCGRGTLGNVLKFVFGATNVTQVQFDSFLRENTSEYSDKRFVWVDELPEYISAQDSSKFEAVLNNMITENTQRKRMMYNDAEMAENYSVVMLSTNYPTSVKVGRSVRRIMPFMQMDKSNGRPPDEVYARLDLLKSGFDASSEKSVRAIWDYAGHFYNYLRHRKITDFSPYGFAPTTSSFTKLVSETATPLFSLLALDIDSRRGIFVSDIVTMEALKSHLAVYYPAFVYTEGGLKRLISSSTVLRDDQLFIELLEVATGQPRKIAHNRITVIDKNHPLIKFEKAMIDGKHTPSMLVVRNPGYWLGVDNSTVLTEYCKINNVGIDPGMTDNDIKKFTETLSNKVVRLA